MYTACSSEPTEEHDNPRNAVGCAGQEASCLSAQVPVRHEHGDVALGGDGKALLVENAAPVEQRVELEDNTET